MRKWLLAGAAAIVIGLGAWFGYEAWQRSAAPPDAAVKPVGDTLLDQAQGPSNVETVDISPDPALTRGTTPMAQRVAVLGLLNKRNGEARDVTLKPGEATRIGEVVIRLRACEQTAPWEPDHYTGAFVQVDVEQNDRRWRRVFSGWLFKERPGLNVVQHPIYDVWTKSCAMTFPATGPATVSVAEASENRSSAKKSPAAVEPEPAAPPPSAPATQPSTAPAKNPT